MSGEFNLNPKETDFLYNIGKIFTSTPDLESLLNQVLILIANYLNIQKGMINLYRSETDKIVMDVSYGYTEKEKKRGTYKPGEGITGMVYTTGEPMLIPSVKDEPRFLNKTGALSPDMQVNTAFICVPIKIDNNTIGTISISKNRDDKTDLHEDVKTITSVAIMIAHAVNTRLELLQQEEILKEENRKLQIQLQEKLSQRKIIGNSHIMQELYEKILLVAPTSSTVLITGESGTGKELIAEAIHENSDRKDQPFIKVNIAALPETLIESEMFGHEKGAFTGAIAQKKGRFELANGGTIFLDEIGDLSLNLQVKLLRVIQERQVERIGSSQPIPLDVRIITATHQNLENKIANNEFRSDLYYRLNVFPIYAPPLRERKSDILQLADHFLEKYNIKLNKNIKRISSETIDILVSYHWPGNVRELENCIERAVIMSREDVIRSYHLPPSLQMATEDVNPIGNTLEEITDNFVREIIIDNLKLSKGNITQAAERLKTTKRILNYKINTLGIDYTKYKV